MSKKTKFEAGGNEDDYVKKCMTCTHAYTRRDESDMLFCSCKNGCNYKAYKQKGSEENG